MVFRKLYLSNFGKFKEFPLELEDGLNLICQPNEWGKSTITAFIKYIFYGQKGRKGTIPDEKARYAPMDGGKPGGWIWFSHEGRELRLERSGGAREKVALFNQTTGLAEPVDFAGEPGEYFFGVDAGTFERSALMYQSTLEVTPYGELETRIRNLVSSGQEDVSVDLARSTLSKASKTYENRLGGKLARLREKIERLTQEIEQAEEAYQRLGEQAEQLTGLERALSRAEQEEQSLAQTVEQARQQRSLGRSAELRTAREVLRQTEDELRREAAQFQGFLPDQAYLEELRGFVSRTAEDEAALKLQRQQLETLEAQRPPEEEEPPLEEPAPRSQLPGLLVLAAALASGTLGALGLLRLPLLLLAGILAVAGAGLLLYTIRCNHRALTEAHQQAERQRQAVRDRAEAWRDSQAAQLRQASDRLAQLQREAQQRYETLNQLLGRAGMSALGPEMLQQAIARLESAYFRREELQQKRTAAQERVSYLEADGVTEAEEGDAQEVQPLSEEQLQRLEGQLADRRSAVFSLRERTAVARSTLEHFKESLPDQAALLAERESEEEELRNGERRHAALLLAQQVLEDAYDEIRSLFAPQLGELAGQYYARLTGGKYEQLVTDERFGMHAVQNGMQAEFVHLSQGARDSAYLALRLAISSLIYPGDQPPLVLDDAFAYLDDERLDLALQLLKELAENRQILVFSCQARARSCWETLSSKES